MDINNNQLTPEEILRQRRRLLRQSAIRFAKFWILVRCRDIHRVLIDISYWKQLVDWIEDTQLFVDEPELRTVFIENLSYELDS